MAVEGKPLCRGNIFLGPHKLGSSSKPDALGDFGWCVSTSAENYMLAMSCLPGLAQDPAFAGVTSSKNVAAALGWEQQLLKREHKQLGQMARQVVFIPAGQMQTGKPRLCISPHVWYPLSHAIAHVLAQENKNCFLIPLQYLQHPRGLHPFTSMDCAYKALESFWMQPDETAGRILKEKKSGGESKSAQVCLWQFHFI